MIHYLEILLLVIIGLFVSCSSDEPVQKVEKPGQETEEPGQGTEDPGQEIEDPGPGSGWCCDEFEPFEFDYTGIDFHIVNIEDTEFKDYYGEIPAEGGSFSISHEYNFYLVSKNNKYSMLKLFINGEYIHGNQDKYGYVPSDGIEYCGDWGSVVTRFEGRKTITTFTIEKNETSNHRYISIHLSYITIVAKIYLGQKSL